MEKLTDILTDPEGRKYFYCRLTFEETELSPWIFKELRPGLVDALMKDMESRWILEPITCYMEDNKIWIANGKHRYEAAKKHDQMLAQGQIKGEEWMKKPLEARVYVDLKPHEIPDLAMALDDVRKKAAAGEKLVGLAHTYASIKRDVERQGKSASEEDLLPMLGWVKVRIKYRKGKSLIPPPVVKTVITAHHIYRMVQENPLLGGMIRARQIPRRKLEYEVRNGRYPLMTYENLAHALQHLVRAHPTSRNELRSGEDPREIEYQNLVKALELLAQHVIIPLAKLDLDKAVVLCSRFPLEAVGLALRDVFVSEYKVSSVAPLAQKKIIDWQPYIERIERLKKVNWTDPVLRSTRSAKDLYQGIGCPAISTYLYP